MWEMCALSAQQKIKIELYTKSYECFYVQVKFKPMQDYAIENVSLSPNEVAPDMTFETCCFYLQFCISTHTEREVLHWFVVSNRIENECNYCYFTFLKSPSLQALRRLNEPFAIVCESTVSVCMCVRFNWMVTTRCWDFARFAILFQCNLVMALKLDFHSISCVHFFFLLRLNCVDTHFVLLLNHS